VPDLVQIRSRPLARGQAGPEADDVVTPEGVAKVYIETYGCQMNEADSSLILGQMKRAGYARTKQPEDADVILVNTCAVREAAEDRVYGRTSQLAALRAQKPHLVVGITGCMAEHLREKLETTAPYVNLVVGPDSYRNLPSLVESALGGARAVDVSLDKTEVYEGLDGDTASDGISGYATIQRGCDKFCTFCVVPFTRGRERSVPPREILRQVRHLAEHGYREVTLLGQTVNSYRYESATFAQLLAAVCEVEGIQRVRFTSPYPVDFTDDVIEAMATQPKLCPYVHLPVQSGSDRVLERMKRGYTREQYVELVRKLRVIPDLAISTDLMVGFCGETEDDHEQTLALIREIGFASAFMFRYSDRDITYASKRLQDDVPDEVKARRLKEVIDLQETFTRADHQARIGKDETILISGVSRRQNYLLGRTARLQSALVPLGSAKPGDMITRRITATTGHTLIAADPLH
jgi:tRNA-2-methylthio-N6-dimethylallyladenosine synthase